VQLLADTNAMKKTIAFVMSHESDSTRMATNSATSIIALTLTRALGRAGVEVVRIHPNRFDHSLRSRYCVNTEYCPDLYQSDDELTRFLLQLDAKYSGIKVLIPASDDCSLYLARNAHDLASKFILLNPSAETMESVKDKQRQYRLANKVNVPIPETYFPKSVHEAQKIAAGLNRFPYIIKPLEAQKWRLLQYASIANGRKAIVVESREQLIAEYDRISFSDAELMIQEIVPGADENLVTFLGYCSAEQKPLAYCVRKKLRQAPVDFGYCTATVSCHNDVVVEYSKRILKESAYTGIVGIEFKFDTDEEKYKLIEINTRPVNTTGLSIGCGVNLPLIAFRDAIGEEQTPVEDWLDNVVWLHLGEDVAAALELRRRGRLTIGEWLNSIRGKRFHAIFAGDDLRPVFAFYASYLRRKIRRLLKSDRNNKPSQNWFKKATNWMS